MEVGGTRDSKATHAHIGLQTLNITRKSVRGHRQQGARVSHPQQEQVVPMGQPVPGLGSRVLNCAGMFVVSDATQSKHLHVEAPAKPEDAVERHTGRRGSAEQA